MTQHYKDSQNKLYGYKPEGIDVTPITMDEVRAIIAERNKPTAEQLAAKIPALRYAEEERGVTLNNVRYAGDESNRQALREAVDMATKAGRTVFETWKDSDGNYLPNHPVSEVAQALDAIFQRRSDLIGLEGKYVKQVLAGEITDLSTLTWETI